MFYNVAFDVHGTLDNDKNDFLITLLNTCIENSRDKVFIISGPPTEQITKEISALGINPDSVTIISVVDWLKNKGIYMWQDSKGTWWCDNCIWWRSKGKICEEYKIDMIFDDHQGYQEFMPKKTQFIYWR